MTHVALLRAVNVGGTGKLAMADLARLCAKSGFTDVRTYIQSGNVVFKSRLAAAKACETLERALVKHMGSAVGVVIRDPRALRLVVRNNPFPDAPPARVMVHFSSVPIVRDNFVGVTGPDGEQVVATDHDVYVFYPEGLGRSKLKLPKMAGVVTTRNMNTVRTLADMCEE